MTNSAVPQDSWSEYPSNVPARRTPDPRRDDHAPDPIAAWPIQRPPSGALHAAPDQSGVWSVERPATGSYSSVPEEYAWAVSRPPSAYLPGVPEQRSRPVEEWADRRPEDRPPAQPLERPPARPVERAFHWSDERPTERPGAQLALPEPVAERWAEERPVTELVVPEAASARVVERAPSGAIPVVPEQSPSWPIDRPLTGSFPAVPVWGEPLHNDPVNGYQPRRLSGRAGRDDITRAGLLGAVWAMGLLVAWTWIAGGALQQLVSGDLVLFLRACGHFAALIASGLLLVQVVLMARLPALENTIGRDEIVRMHAKVGFASFFAMLAHIAIAVLAYAGANVAKMPGTFWSLTWTYPGMLLAVVGTLAIIAVVMTSAKKVRTRLNYETWHLTHLYAYLGVGLALPHQLWTGKDFLRSPVITALWWAMWVLTFAVVVLWRVLIPLMRSIRHDVRVAGVVRENDKMLSVYMTGRHLDELAEAGQFLVWRFVDRPGWYRANPFSISAAPRPDRLRITVREAGDGTRSLATLEPGTRVMVEGAYGRLSARARTHRKVALFGAGSGMAPLRSLAEGLAYNPGEVVMMERYTDEPYLPNELEWLADTRGMKLVRFPGKRRGPDSWVGEGYDGDSDAEVVRGWLPDLEQYDVYLCGPGPWAASVRRAVLEAGLPAEQLHMEAFAW